MAPDGRLNEVPHVVYVFGKLGGPFKVGYTKAANIKSRAAAIRSFCPGALLAGKASCMWHTQPCADEYSARTVESVAHRLLGDGAKTEWRGHHGSGKHNFEWFTVSLPTAVRAVERATHLATVDNRYTRRQLRRLGFRYFHLTTEMVEQINDYRAQHPIGPRGIMSFNSAVRRLIGIALEARNTERAALK